jgi:cobalt-precorrin 5A hydrolase
MDLGEAMIVAGIGCRRGASIADIEGAIEAALSRAGYSSDALGAIATAAIKANEHGLEAAAAQRGLSLVLIARSDLKAASARALTQSARVAAAVGVASVAEAAALVAAGPGARLLGPRIAVGAATCALAAAGAEP